MSAGGSSRPRVSFSLWAGAILSLMLVLRGCDVVRLDALSASRD